jgi:hypothetical protein
MEELIRQFPSPLHSGRWFLLLRYILNYVSPLLEQFCLNTQLIESIAADKTYTLSDSNMKLLEEKVSGFVALPEGRASSKLFYW